MLQVLAAALLLGSSLSDEGCALDEAGHLACFDLSDHCVAARPVDAFRSFDEDQGVGCGVRKDGSVACWGRDAALELPGPARQVDVSTTLACVLLETGRVRCADRKGTAEVPSFEFVQISVGHDLACGVRTNGQIACWGPDAVRVPTGRFRAVSVGFGGACGLDPRGQIACWGLLALRAPAGRFQSVACATQGAALRADGSAVVFDGAGQRPVGPPGTRFSEVSSACGRLRSGELACWSPHDVLHLKVDDGRTLIAAADGRCHPANANVFVKRGPRSAHVDEVILRIRVNDPSLNPETERVQVRPEDVPHYASAYFSLPTWPQRLKLLSVLVDSSDPVLSELMWDVLDVPDDALDAPYAHAVALTFFDGTRTDFNRYMKDLTLAKSRSRQLLSERKQRGSPHHPP